MPVILPVMIQDVFARVEERLKVVGLSASAASKLAGLSEDAIRNLKRATGAAERKGVSTRTISALAPVLKTSAGWLLSAEGEADVETSAYTVPVVGYVGAGDAAHFYEVDQGEIDRIEAPDNATDGTTAREIRGNSIGRFFDGWILFTNPRQRGVPGAYIGELCEVHLPDGRVLVKQVQKSKFEGLYHLFSETEPPMMDEEVEWSAKVIGMRPR